jgi:hypothetical protein
MERPIATPKNIITGTGDEFADEIIRKPPNVES